MALKRREVQCAKLATQARERAPEIGGMIHEICHNTSSGRAFEASLGFGPMSPPFAEDRLLCLGRRTVKGIGLRQRQLDARS